MIEKYKLICPECKEDEHTTLYVEMLHSYNEGIRRVVFFCHNCHMKFNVDFRSGTDFEEIDDYLYDDEGSVRTYEDRCSCIECYYTHLVEE